MTEGAGGPGEAPAVLTLQIEGGPGEPERVLQIARAGSGRVRVREWSGADWGAGAPERDVPAAEVLALVERAVAERRRVSEELYRIRHWLAGTAL